MGLNTEESYWGKHLGEKMGREMGKAGRGVR